MTSIKSRAVTGSRSSSRGARSAASGLVRAGLLGSTALVAVGLAATGAVAQTVVSPADGGTIARIGGSNPTVSDQSGSGGGVQLTNVTQSTGIQVDGVTINNTTGTPSIDALRIQGSTGGLNSTGVSLTGVNALTTTANGGSALHISTNANLGVAIDSSGSIFTGSYGINLQAPSGYIYFDASSQSQSFVANGSHIAGINAVSAINASIQLGSSTITGFDTGINASNFYGSFIEMTGGSINALVTGIRADATGGRSNIESQAAIVAPTGIHSTNTAGAQITTSGAGTINSTANGVGTGIIATSSGGTVLDPFSINVGAAIGNITAFGTGVSASTTGSSANVININTTAAITATGRGVSVTAGTFGNTGTINIGGDITGATGVYTNIGNYTVNVDAGVTVTSTGNGFSNGAIYLVNGANTLINNGTLIANGTGTAGLHYSSPNGMATNTATGTITGSTGVYYQNNASLTNAGGITGTGVGATDAGIRSLGGTFNNTGSISGNTGLYNSGNVFNVNNTGGTITGATHGISMAGGFLRLVNTGTITGTDGSGVLVTVASTAADQQITNSGTISGGSDATNGFGVHVADGIFVLTNQAGGTISGGTGGIRLASDDLATLNLNVGSTVNGDIVSSNTGDRTITVAGTLNGDYVGTSGTGTTTFALATGGAMQGASFGSGTTTFNWTGGTIAGAVSTTNGGYQHLNVNLGTGGTGTIGDISRFFLNANSGTVTLTGVNTTTLKLLGGNIVLDTDLNTGGATSASFQSTPGSTLTVNAGRSLISSTSAVNLSATGTVTNAGTISGGQMNGVNSSFYFYGVNNQVAGSVINNSGTIAVGEYNLVAAIQNSGNLQVNNTGLIRAGSVSSTLTTDGIRSYGGTLTVANSTAGSIIAGGEAAILTTGGTLALTNVGYVVGATNAINAAGTVSITNSGTIGNGQVTDMGVYTAGGTGYAISTHGGTVINSGTIHGASAGIYSSNGLTLTNTGTISGGEGDVALFRDGVAVLNAPATVLNAGTISSQTYSALLIQGGTITNAGAGSLSGGTDLIAGVAVQFSATGGTFTNYGSATGTGAGAVRVNTPGAATTINLHAGSTTGAILLNSGNDVVAIHNGRGATSGATVDGASGITLQAAGTLAAASFGAIDMGAGTNTLVLAGIGDGTAANGATGTIATGSITGVSNLSKIDSGLWTLTGAGGYAGTTTVSGGTLRVLNTGGGLGNGAVSIGTGATLNFDNQTGGLLYIKGDTFTGAGRILFSGDTGSVTALGYGGNGNVVISLSQGGLIDVQSGTVNGSSSGQGLWTSNMGSLNIASGAHFDTVEGLVRVDALTGAGSLSGGYGGTVPITLGVAGGSGTFSGVIRDSTEFAGRYLALTKVGAGTQTLSGTNTYTGQTSIQAGTLEVRGGSAILDTGVVSVSSGATFLVSNAETIGRLTGAGAVNLANGSLTLSNSSGTYSGAVSGSGSLVLSGGSLSLGGALTNSGGLVLGGTTGASLLSTGSITVAGNAVTMNGTANSLTNAGAVSSSVGTGVTASGGLTLSNNAGGTISGQMGVYSGGVGTVTNAAGASISAGSLNNTVRLAGNGSTLTNAGSISGTTNFAGVFFDRTGTVINQAGGTISNTATAVQLAGNGSSLVNAGAITSNSGFSGVYFDGSGTVINQAGGVISNTGQAIGFGGTGSSLDNAGTISNTGPGSAVYLGGAGSVVNRSAAGISSVNGRGVRIAGAGASVDNAGLISGGLAGVHLEGANGSVVNTGTLRVTGSTDLAAVHGSAAGASVTNSGTIESTLLNGRGVYLSGGSGTIINQSGGTISGNGSGAAILLAGDGYTLDLQAGSTVTGLIDASATTGLNTVTIGGDLNGAYVGGAGSDVVTLFGGVTSGALLGGDGTDTLILGGLTDSALDIGQTAGFESRALNGNGTWILSGADSDAADWTLDSGTLRLTGSQSVNDGAGVRVNTGATLSVGGSEAINALNGTGSVIIDASQTLYVGANNADSVFSGIISGAGGLSQVGAGTLTLYGANTYSGDTRVDAGTLRLGTSGVIADTSRLIVQSGATLDMQGNDETVAVAWLNGTVNNSVPPPSPLAGGAGDGPQATLLPTGTGTLTAADIWLNGATLNANLGTGFLGNAAGVSILNGTSAAGTVAVVAGTLRLGESERLADSAILSISSGATLDLQGFDETVAVALLSGTLDGAGTPFSPLFSDFGKSPELVAWNPGPVGTGTLTAAEYYLDGATVLANLGTGALFNTGGDSTLYGTVAAGQVSVQAGTLLLGVSNRLADTATLTVSGGATFDLRGNDETVGLALINGTLNTSRPNPAAPLVAPTRADGAQVLPALTFSTKGTDGPLTIPAPTGTGTLTAAEYYLNGATINANLGNGILYTTGGVSTLNGVAAASQVRVYGGSLVLGASDRLSDTGFLFVNAAVLDIQGFNETVGYAAIHGTLNGTGTLSAAGYELNGATVNANLGGGTLFGLGGTSVLTGISAASQVNINAGTLRLGASDRLADTATVSVSSGATFDVNSRIDTVGALYGTGSVAISSGRLSFGGLDSAFGGTLSGAGSLVHTGGLFTLAGNHSLQTISNTGGELRFLATTTGNVAVSGGSLTGAGTIGGALTISAGVTLSPGLAGQANGIGTLSTGSLTLNGGTLAADFTGLSGGNLSDRLVVSGTATLTGGTLAPTFLSSATGHDLLTRYTFLTAGQLVGTFSNGATFVAAPGQSGLFWRVRYDLAPNAAVLELRNLVSFDLGANGSGNQNAVAQALAGGQLQASDDWLGVLGQLSGLNAGQRQVAFDSLGGEALADMSSSMFAANDAFTQAVRDGGAIRTPGTAPLSFASAFSFVGGRDGAAAMITGVLDAFDPSAETRTGRGGWISVHASDIDLEGKAGQADLQTRLNGFVGGYAVGTGDYVLGAAAGATRVEGDVAGRQSSYESDLVHAAGYVRFDDGRWAADLTASVYGGELDSRRTVTIGAFTGQALGRTHGEGQSLSASVARRFADDSGGAVSVGLMQTMSRSAVDGFTERAAGGLSLEVADQERNWQTTQLNLRGTQDYRLSGQPMRLYGGVGVLVTTGDREAGTDMRFSGAAAGFGGFAIEGAQAAPLAGVTEFGLEYQPREGLTLSTGYRAVFSDRLNDNQVGARMSIEW